MHENNMIVSQIINEPLITLAKQLPNEGKLTLSNDQLLYLDIDDRFIHELYQLIAEDNINKPDYFTIGIGAHISIIYPNELTAPRYELQKKYRFHIDSLFRAETHQAIYYALTIHSPELMQIRYDNNLASKLNLNGYIVDMHSTIGKITKKNDRFDLTL